jgi:hypothetical protein
MAIPPVLRTTVRFDYVSSLSFGPYAENTWWFAPDGLITTLEETEAAAAANLERFYTSTIGGTDALVQYFSPQLNGNATILGNVVGTDGSVGPTTTIGSFTFDRTEVDSLPAQVAICLTSRCDPHDGVTRRQSLQNRIFFGPLSVNTSVTNDAGEARPEPVFRELLGIKATELRDTPADDNARWVIYSTKNRSFGDPTGGYVDNVFDTQRSRYDEVTVHTNWS